MVSNLVAMMASTYLTTLISAILPSLSLAHLVLHSSHYLSLAALSSEHLLMLSKASQKILYYKAKAFLFQLNQVFKSPKAVAMLALVVAISYLSLLYSAMALPSSFLSSMMEASREALSSSIFLITASNDSLEKVVATQTKAKMGLEFPILFNSANTSLASLSLAGMVDNLEMINSKAPITSTDYFYLLMKVSASLTLYSSNSIPLLFKISNQVVLILISLSILAISADKIQIS